jgi:hypothetical protein
VTADRAGLAGMLAFAQAQRVPYRPAHAAITGSPGGSVLTIEFAAPSPAGLLSGQALP